MATVIATVIVRRQLMTLFKVLQIVTILLMIILNCYVIKQNLYVINRFEQPNLIVSKCDLINVYDDGKSEETWID